MGVTCHLVVVGKNRDTHLQALIDDYCRRIPWTIIWHEIAPPNVAEAERKTREAALIRAAIPQRAIRIFLDERGTNPDSIEFARKLEHFFLNQNPVLAIVIGGADGLDESLRREADYCLSFGKLTWPHMLVRLMLVEQLYRATTILAGHPYHRS